MRTKSLEQKMLHYFRTAGCADSEFKEDLPSFVRFAHRFGLDMQTLREEREKNASFAHACKECEEILADRIVDGALHKRLDASFAKFLLTARFGYSEKKEEAGTEEFELEIALKEPAYLSNAAQTAEAAGDPKT